jgi:hypothetical protein
LLPRRTWLKRRLIVDPVVSDRLMHMLHRLDAAHSGVVVPSLPSAVTAAGVGSDLNEEGRKILAALLGNDLPHEDEGEAKAAQSMACFCTFIDGADEAHAEEEAAVEA